jgi:uncharacterized protein YndB with AHSA1/START domain
MKTENTIEKRIEIDAPVSRVWRALTDSRQFGEWFRCEIDAPFVQGQPVKARITHPGYEHMTWEGTVQRMEPERVFSFTWHPYPLDPTVDYSKETPTLVEFQLEPAQNGTVLVVTESGFDKIPEYRRDEAFRMNEGGWSGQVKNIAQYVAQHP